MLRYAFSALATLALAASTAAAQTPAFETADVFVRTKTTTANWSMTGGLLRAGRYDLRNATMVDLIATAYGVTAESVLGGPSWLEMTRFDIVAKAPNGTPPNTLKAMLKTLLADRFKLVAHADTKPMPAFALTAGPGRHELKEASSGVAGCQPVPQGPPQAGVIPMVVAACRSMSMDDLASQLRNMAGAYVTEPVVNRTRVEGTWDFELRWTPRPLLAQAGADGISLFDAVDRQLGLKLAPETADAPVLVVDRVNEQPTENPSGVARTGVAPPPAEFDVATIKLSPPGTTGPRVRVQPGGRVDGEGVTLKRMMQEAWDIHDDQMFVGAPSWFDSTRYSFSAVASSSVAGAGPAMQIDSDDFEAMLRALITERFKLKVHWEERLVSAYALVADRPKLQKANPADRTRWKEGPAPNTQDTRDRNLILARLVTAQNMTMAQFADRLESIAPGYIRLPVSDATGLEGAWNFTFSFTPIGLMQTPGTAGGTGAASDPTGALSLPEALNRQLGLKLEMRKRPMQVLVFDSVQEKPEE